MKKYLKFTAAATALLLILSLFSGNASAAEIYEADLGGFVNYYDEPNAPSGSEVFGDSDLDGELKIKDATLIQKYVARSASFSENQERLSDVDGDNTVSVRDATSVQKALAKLINGVPMSRVYDWDLSLTSTEVSLLKNGRARLRLSVPKSGYYYFNVEGVSDRPAFLVTVPTSRGAYRGHSKLSVYLEKGSHELNIYNDSTGNLTTYINYYFSENFSNFDVSKAISVSGKPINVKAGTKNLLLKVKGTEITNPVSIESVGLDPKIYSVSIYDSTLSLISNNSILKGDGTNIFGYLPAYEYMSAYYYIYITHNVGGSDYILTCGSASEIFMSSSSILPLDTAVEAKGEYVESENSDYTLINSCFKFTPSKNAYYEFDVSSSSMGELKYRIYGKSSLQEGMSNPIYTLEAASEMATFSLKDVELLMAGTEYYLVLEGKLYGRGSVTVKASNSTASKYDEIHKNDTLADTDIPQRSSEIKVGDRIFVEINSDKEVKWFKFVASENLRVVVYSEKSEDAFLIVLDKNLNEVGRFDDIKEYSSLDFAALGDVKKGEVYYLGAGSYEGGGDFYSLSLVKESEYLPMT